MLKLIIIPSKGVFYMFNLIRSIGLLIFLLNPLHAAADAGYEERLAVAKQYVTASLEDIDLTKVVKQMWLPLAQQIETDRGSPLRSSQIEKIDKLYQDTFYLKMYNIMSQQDKIMADIFTLEEIVALRDFYYTEEGRSVMNKLPDLVGAQQPMIMKLVQETLPTIIPEIEKIITE